MAVDAAASGLLPGHGASLPEGPRSEDGPVPAPGQPTDAVFEAAYQHHRDALLSWLRARTRDRSVAEELCQEAFARLLRQIRAGRLPDSLPAWLRTVGRNLYISRLRRDRVARRKALPGAASASGDPTLEAALAHETMGAAWAALAGLPAPERDMIVQAVGGSTARQIATLLGITPGAARTRLHRARRHLQGAMLARGLVRRP